MARRAVCDVDCEPHRALRSLDGQARRRLRPRRGRAIYRPHLRRIDVRRAAAHGSARRRASDESPRPLDQRQHPAARGEGWRLRRSVRLASARARPLDRRRGSLQGHVADAVVAPDRRDHAQRPVRRLARTRSRRGRARRRIDVPVGHSLAEPHLHRRGAFRVHERNRSLPRVCGPPLRRARAADA